MVSAGAHTCCPAARHVPARSSIVGATCEAVGVRYSEFWELVEEVLGSAPGREIVANLVVGGLENRTAAAALEDGAEPRTVWHALCDELDIPESERWGADLRRVAPPRR